MTIFRRGLILAACLQLAACASTPSPWWNESETQGKPGQRWQHRYTVHSFTKKHENAHRDATKQLKRWAEWKCPVAGYEVRDLRVIEQPQPTSTSGLLTMYYGVSAAIRKSFTLEMDIKCRYPGQKEKDLRAEKKAQ